MIDGVNVLLDEAIEEGLLDDLIVVIPNSDPNSWWKDQWETMVVEDLIPHIDANYRTVKDARYRFTAGCSMGGQGAASIALTNPDLFSGFAAFYGAFYGGYPAYNYFFSFGDSMGDISPITVAKNEGAEYMKNFSMAFICGNQDDYTFGLGKIELHQLLEDYGVDHYFLIENGRHEGAFYLPRFKETLSYAELKTTKDGLTLTFAAKDIIEKYFAENPDSPYTKTETPALNIPLRITVTQNGRQYQALLEDHVLEPGQQASVITLSAEDFVAITRSTGGFDPTKKFTYKIEGAIFDNGWVVLGEVSDELMAAVGLLPETGDHSNVMLYAALLAVSMGVCALLRKKSRA